MRRKKEVKKKYVASCQRLHLPQHIDRKYYLTASPERRYDHSASIRKPRIAKET